MPLGVGLVRVHPSPFPCGVPVSAIAGRDQREHDDGGFGQRRDGEGRGLYERMGDLDRHLNLLRKAGIVE